MTAKFKQHISRLFCNDRFVAPRYVDECESTHVSIVCQRSAICTSVDAVTPSGLDMQYAPGRYTISGGSLSA